MIWGVGYLSVSVAGSGFCRGFWGRARRSGNAASSAVRSRRGVVESLRRLRFGRVRRMRACLGGGGLRWIGIRECHESSKSEFLAAGIGDEGLRFGRF